jgi:hypothetical protein
MTEGYFTRSAARASSSSQRSSSSRVDTPPASRYSGTESRWMNSGFRPKALRVA